MKTPSRRIRGTLMLCVTLLLSACSAKRVAEETPYPYAPGESPAAPDLPAAMSLMQPHATYANLAELRHYSAYNAFHSTMSSGSSGNAGANAPASCFGNQ